MGPVIGQILPLAIGIAISPMPIIATILMIMSTRGRTTSLGFLLGWVLGVIAAVTAFTLLSSLLPDGGPTGPQPIKGVIQLALGVLLLLLAARQWRSRPKAGQPGTLPKWMQAIDSMRMLPAIGLGFALVALNPKNLLLSVSTGATIGAGALDVAATVVVIAVFVVIASLTVAVPVIGYALAADRLAGALAALREWLTRENAAIMAIVLVVLAASVIGKGIGSF